MSSSTSSGQILDDNLSNQINNALESSDSEDDALGEQILNMTRGHEILPDLTESQVNDKTRLKVLFFPNFSFTAHSKRQMKA